MDKILIVEDRHAGNHHIDELLSGWQDQEYIVVSCEKEAAGVLKTENIALSIFELSSGFGVHPRNLANLTFSFPHIPSIAVLNKEQKLEDTLKALGVYAFLYLPAGSKELKEQIDWVLGQSITGEVRGIPVHSFLQMVGNEQLTCTLKIVCGEKRGTIYILDGEPVSAELGGLLNEEAMYSLIVMENPTIEMCHYNRQRPKGIEKSLMGMLIDAFHYKDEQDTETRECEKQVDPKDISWSPAHSVAENDKLKIEIGSDLLIEVASIDHPIKVSLVGISRGEFLFTTVPNPYDVFEKACKNNNRLTVKYVDRGQLCLFPTKLLGELQAPLNMIILEYPSTVYFNELRAVGRKAAFVPTTLTGKLLKRNYVLSGVIVDISTRGCLYYVEVRGNNFLPNLSIGSSVKLYCYPPDSTQKESISGEVRNLKINSTELYLGIQFSDVSDDYRQKIENYTPEYQAVEN